MNYSRNSILYVIMNIIPILLLLIIEYIELIPGKAFAQTISPDSTEEIFIDSRDSPEKLVDTHPYTKEEMLSAIPYEWQSPQGEAPEGEVIPQMSSEYVIGEPGSIEGEPPEEQKILEAMPPEASSDEFVDHNAELLTTGTGYPGPYTRYENFDAYTTYPYRTIGKLFFRAYGSTQLSSCTAVTIGNNAIWTAGHCVSDGAGHWHNSWVFVPAYRDGEAPFGQWPAFFARTFQDWYHSSNIARDSGGLVLRTQNGVKIGSKLGYLGFSWNQYPVSIHWHAIGYPGEIAYGLRQIICTGSLVEFDINQSLPRPVGMGCDMKNGASGGPWIRYFGSYNYLNGNVSYGYDQDKPHELFSPYFDTHSKSMRDYLVSQ